MITRDKVKLDLKIPFRKGNQIGYPECSFTLKKNGIFKATLTYDNYSRGRSSVKFLFKNEKGKEFEMFATDFSELVKSTDLSKPVTGEWAFVKRGANFGLVKII